MEKDPQEPRRTKGVGFFFFRTAAAAFRRVASDFWGKISVYAKLTQKIRKKMRKIYEDRKAVFGVGPKNGFFVKRVSFLRYKTVKFAEICLKR